MKIQENDFILESINDHSEMFDVSLLCKVNKGKENEREEMKIVAYGVPFEIALRYVIQHRTIHRLGEVTTLKDYIKVYREIYKELKETINK